VLLGRVLPMGAVDVAGRLFLRTRRKGAVLRPRSSPRAAGGEYPDGFRIPIHTFADRPTNVPAWQAAALMAFDTLIERAMATIDDAARERRLMQATQMLADDVGYILLYTVINSWAFKRSVIFEA
jgi:hypothetical protein